MIGHRCRCPRLTRLVGHAVTGPSVMAGDQRASRMGRPMFISRLVEGSDTRVFGLAVAMKHVPGRDNATPHDIALRPWKSNWPHYIRVHHAEFVAGTMQNGMSLGELMNTLGADSFASTQRNRERGSGNIKPRRALMQQPGVKLCLSMATRGSANGSRRLSKRMEGSRRRNSANWTNRRFLSAHKPNTARGLL